MKDELGFSPLCGLEESAYITPINETLKSYKCLVTGFETNDLMKLDEFDFETFEETLPELYKDIKQVDSDKRVWYPQTINIEGVGIIFVLGTSRDDWEWAAIKSIKVREEEKEKFKNPTTGEYIKYKNDPSTLTKFGKEGFIDSLDYLDLIN